MKQFLLGVLFALSLCLNPHIGHSQLSANVLVPPGGAVDKQQLWNMVVSNTSNGPISFRLQLSFTEVSTGLPVFLATTSDVFLETGTKQLSASNLGLISYTILNPSYRIDPGPTGLLPVGNFQACYEFMLVKSANIVQECVNVIIPPLEPLILFTPSNYDTLSNNYPNFSWIPPSKINSLNQMRYGLRLVEVFSNQAPAEAVQQNIPLFTVSGLSTPNYQYNQSSPALNANKQYAWQVFLENNFTPVATSEVWSFYTKSASSLHAPGIPDTMYLKLSKSDAAKGQGIVWGIIRLDFFNESPDKEWKILVQDLTTLQRPTFGLHPDSALKTGQNLYRYNAADDSRFVHKHQYILKILNSRNDTWMLRFEYRKPEE